MIACRRASFLVCVVVLALALPARAQTPSSQTAPVAVAPQPGAAPAAEASLPVRLAFQLEAAQGVGTGPFSNRLLGGRADWRFSQKLSLGAYLGYANLKGKDGRAHSALTYAELEYLAGDPASTVRWPVRFASGYLGANGPVVRLAGGLAIALSPKVDLVPELASMVWFTNNQTLLSLNLALELSFKL